MLTVGDLCATHLGRPVTAVVPVGEATETISGTLARVQHDGPHNPPEGDAMAAQTLVVVGPWSGPLDPDHPVEVGS